MRALGDLGTDAKTLAGGTAIVLLYRLGLIEPRYLVPLRGIAELDRIRFVSGTGLHIGATNTHRAVETSPCVRDGVPGRIG